MIRSGFRFCSFIIRLRKS